MIEATSCGGVVIFRGKILLLYKNFKNRYEGWVLPKGTVEKGEKHVETALREVFEESGVKATVMRYIGKSEYSFSVPQDVVEKEVYWYLMMADNYYSRPQREEFFVDSGYYKYHEAYHLLRFSNEKQILERAYQEYLDLRRTRQWIKPR
ncbi:MAG: NUDIX domain-containing protein [Lachnospiraceae bacterium]|jgi:ADP-ribose pyrophosphatase|nr:NUDIX domain-containing protein [Lachnospiraceae bacterium]MCI9399509.1 NUDIX domain-containing protein [Lachnospiraceae bacterium]MCX4375816.1 NUDIX domain-containing protein [Lachnospiraceae bacterium]